MEIQIDKINNFSKISQKENMDPQQEKTKEEFVLKQKV